jgi:hypothetical protein
VSRPTAAELQPVRRDAIAYKVLLLAVILLALPAITGCSGRSTPDVGRIEPAATSPVVVQAATPTPVPATATAPRPTATFVPLITPSATPEGALTEIIVPRISIEVARQMAEAGRAVLVDVRTRATFEQAHIAGAISLPAEEIPDRYNELATDQLIIFY